MKTQVVNLGLNEKSTVIIDSQQDSNSPYEQKQSQIHQYLTHDLIYEHIPNLNGGYAILVEPGPWVDLVSSDDILKKKYGSSISNFSSIVNEFITKSLKLAYQIDPGSISVNSDNYNLRNMTQNTFSYKAKINSITITYLEEKNIVEFIHNVWIEFMEHLKKGYISLPSEYLAADTDIFYQVPYYGQIWAYAFDPVTLWPREIVRYIGVFPSNNSLSENFGQRGQNNHYVKSISYNVVDVDSATYVVEGNKKSKDHFNKFYQDSILFKEFIDNCVEHGILK